MLNKPISPEAKEVLDRLAGRNILTLEEVWEKFQVASSPIISPIVESVIGNFIKNPLLKNMLGTAIIEIAGQKIKNMIMKGVLNEKASYPLTGPWFTTNTPSF